LLLLLFSFFLSLEASWCMRNALSFKAVRQRGKERGPSSSKTMERERQRLYSFHRRRWAQYSCLAPLTRFFLLWAPPNYYFVCFLFLLDIHYFSSYYGMLLLHSRAGKQTARLTITAYSLTFPIPSLSFLARPRACTVLGTVLGIAPSPK
jgi:hypothetical protein